MRELDVLCKRKEANDRRIEQHSAQIACLLYNINRGERNPALKIEDFMTKKNFVKGKEQSMEEMKHLAKLITKAFNGEIR